MMLFRYKSTKPRVERTVLDATDSLILDTLAVWMAHATYFGGCPSPPECEALIARLRQSSDEWIWGYGRDGFPSRPGVYCFWMDRLPLYVGYSTNIRRRMKGHRWEQNEICGRRFEGDPQLMDIRYRVVEDEKTARELELELIRTLKPSHNIAGCR